MMMNIMSKSIVTLGIGLSAIGATVASGLTGVIPDTPPELNTDYSYATAAYGFEDNASRYDLGEMPDNDGSMTVAIGDDVATVYVSPGNRLTNKSSTGVAAARRVVEDTSDTGGTTSAMNNSISDTGSTVKDVGDSPSPIVSEDPPEVSVPSEPEVSVPEPDENQRLVESIVNGSVEVSKPDTGIKDESSGQAEPDNPDADDGNSVEDVLSKILGGKVTIGSASSGTSDEAYSTYSTSDDEDFMEQVIRDTLDRQQRRSDSLQLSNPALIDMKNAYPTGTYWGDSEYYKWNGGIYRGGYGCAGFAYMLSDAVFGSSPARMIGGNSDVQPYDCVELYNNAHTAFVLSVNGDGTITVAEGNVNDSVIWGSTYSISDISAVLRR